MGGYKQREWIQQVLQLVQTFRVNDGLKVTYPEEEAHFIVAKCWNIGVTLLRKNLHFYQVVESMIYKAKNNATSKQNKTITDGVAVSNDTSAGNEHCNDATWYLETAIALAKICGLKYVHLINMFDTLKGSTETADKKLSESHTSSSSIISELNSVLRPYP